MKLKMTVFWNISCYLVDPARRFRGVYCLHHQADESSETSVNIYQTTRRNIPEDSHLHLVTC
jgi:hypothetical protein